MTEAQKMTYDFIKSYIERTGRSPSVRDIQLHMGYQSTSSVKRLLDCLVERGKIGRLWGKHRSLFIVPDSDDPVRVKALDACRLLISAYSVGGSPTKPNWAEVHDAFMAARAALSYHYNAESQRGRVQPASTGVVVPSHLLAASSDGGCGVRPGRQQQEPVFVIRPTKEAGTA